MLSTGLVRRIDAMGRIAIPKQLRGAHRYRDGDELEVFVSESQIVLRRFSRIDTTSSVGRLFAKSLNSTTGHNVLVTDRYCVVAHEGTSRNKHIGKNIGAPIMNAIDNRESGIFVKHNEKPLSLLDDPSLIQVSSAAISPIVSSDGFIIGALVLYSNDSKKLINESEQIVTDSIANVMGVQLSADA